MAESVDVVHLPIYSSNEAMTTFKQRASDEKQEALRRRQEEEARELHEKENTFWAKLALGDVDKVHGMVQVVSLYQQQIRENETIINDLNMRIETNDRTHRGLRRRYQQSQQGVIVVNEQENNLSQELEHWARKRERCPHDDIRSLQLQHGSLQEELRSLLAEAGTARHTLLDLRTRLNASLSTFEEQKVSHREYEESCQQSLESMKSELGAELYDLRSEELSRLRSALTDAQSRVCHLSHENHEVFEDLRTQQQEGNRLQQQCAEAREKVLQLATEVRAFLDEPRVASQLGLSLDGSMASMSFLPSLGDDPYHDSELESIRRQCKTLERECQRTNDALERKQLECERWRVRYMETRPGHHGTVDVLNVGDAPEEARVPFVLGPEPGASEENFLASPRF